MITRTFAMSEFVGSHTATRLGIDNSPSASVSATIINILAPCMQQIRDLLGVPVIIKSGYRCPVLNRTVRGAWNSQHLTGNAADFVAPTFGSPREICAFMVQHMDEIGFDQLIHEVAWVHVSFAVHKRAQVLTAHFTDAGVHYTPGLA